MNCRTALDLYLPILSFPPERRNAMLRYCICIVFSREDYIHTRLASLYFIFDRMQTGQP